jgi:hypothetical protein
MNSPDSFECAGKILQEGGFVVEDRHLENLGKIIIAENDYSLVVVITDPWDAFSERIEDAQAELTRLAAIHPSPRRWDLYLVLDVGS